MCAALVKARRAGVGPDLKAVIDHWSDYVAHKQFRLADGTLARQRPQPESLWADDLYMSVPALAQMGALTGDRAWFDDAVKQVLQFHRTCGTPRPGSTRTAGTWTSRSTRSSTGPARTAGRCWPRWSCSTCCPRTTRGGSCARGAARADPQRGQAAVRASGLWHQMLDKPDSYLETSASAIFVYWIARAIDQGWISPASYGSVAQAGWIGVTTRVNAKGQVEGTCVGTTLASDHVYYYNRPQSVYATHGYGPVLLAGAEMIRLLKNPGDRRPVQAADLPLRAEDGREGQLSAVAGAGLRTLARLALRLAPSARARGARSSRAGRAPGCGSGSRRRSGGGSRPTRAG